MPRYAAFLRAINVGGRVVKMEALRAIFERLGFENVTTFIASGNVLFETTARSGDGLEPRIEAALEKALGYRSAAFVRSSADLQALVRQPCLLAVPKGVTRSVAFTRAELSPALKRKVTALTSDINDFKVFKREVIWTCQVRFSEAGFYTADLEKVIDTEATLRNATTVRTIATKLTEG